MSDNDAEVFDTVETTKGEMFRARIVQDVYAEEPENDGGCPVVRLESRYGGTDAEMTGYGQCSGYPDGLPESAADILTRFNVYDKRTAIDTFERYLRIFHDGNLVEYGPNQGTDYTYVAYVTRTLWEAWGNTGEVGKADLNEYRAWVEGDVYGVIVEELTTWTKSDSSETRESWEEVDSCFGFYGLRYAEESAREELDTWVAKGVRS